MLNLTAIKETITQSLTAAEAAVLSLDTYVQLAAAILALVIAWWLPSLIARVGEPDSTLQRITSRLRILLKPALSALLVLIAAALSQALLGEDWLLRGVVMITALWLLEGIIRLMQVGRLLAQLLRLIVLVFLGLHLLGVLTPVTTALESMSIEVGNLHFTLSGLLRVLIFGSLLFWLGWISNAAGQNAIRRQERLDVRTREVVAKLFQIGLSVLVLLLFLQVMGINLATLAVFGGAVGVGLGFGLQSISSNFISGIIILFDRSLSVGDYIEIEGGQSGYVRELTLRYTTLEGFDGKNVLVPNESFITKPFTNWTHKNHKQRYRVDFSVAYDTDIRKLCEIVRVAVASHPQVISGDRIPVEERPDCEIDSFGDSGVKMFVEFWMDGIDDGPNRVGGDLLLLIFETLREHGVVMPFPQQEVRILQNTPA